MYELRWNPVLKWWVMVSSERQDRPLIPESYCPFCPESDRVPDNYEVLSYNNDWQIQKPNPTEINSKFSSDIYKEAKSYGKRELILYSPKYNINLGDLSFQQFEKLMDLWVEMKLN